MDTIDNLFKIMHKFSNSYQRHVYDLNVEKELELAWWAPISVLEQLPERFIGFSDNPNAIYYINDNSHKIIEEMKPLINYYENQNILHLRRDIVDIRPESHFVPPNISLNYNDDVVDIFVKTYLRPEISTTNCYDTNAYYNYILKSDLFKYLKLFSLNPKAGKYLLSEEYSEFISTNYIYANPSVVKLPNGYNLINEMIINRTPNLLDDIVFNEEERKMLSLNPHNWVASRSLTSNLPYDTNYQCMNQNKYIIRNIIGHLNHNGGRDKYGNILYDINLFTKNHNEEVVKYMLSIYPDGSDERRNYVRNNMDNPNLVDQIITLLMEDEIAYLCSEGINRMIDLSKEIKDSYIKLCKNPALFVPPHKNIPPEI